MLLDTPRRIALWSLCMREQVEALTGRRRRSRAVCVGGRFVLAYDQVRDEIREGRDQFLAMSCF